LKEEGLFARMWEIIRTIGSSYTLPPKSRFRPLNKRLYAQPLQNQLKQMISKKVNAKKSVLLR
jgi:hypothetical protein